MNTYVNVKFLYKIHDGAFSGLDCASGNLPGLGTNSGRFPGRGERQYQSEPSGTEMESFVPLRGELLMVSWAFIRAVRSLMICIP